MSNCYSIFSLARPWTAQDYTTLLDLATTFCNSFILVSRARLLAEGNDLLESLNPFIVGVRRAAAWPGTRLIGVETAEIRKFRLTDDSLGVLRRAANSPWDWLGPQHPEDLSFLRPSGSPWFISITHEHDGFFKLLANEKEAVETAFGNMSLVFECEDQCPEEVY